MCDLGRISKQGETVELIRPVSPGPHGWASSDPPSLSLCEERSFCVYMLSSETEKLSSTLKQNQHPNNTEAKQDEMASVQW